MKDKIIFSKIFIYTFFATIILFSIKFFQSFPFRSEFFKFQFLFFLFLLFFIFFYIGDKLLKNNYIDAYIIYIVFISFFIPIYSAIRAYTLFKQPILYGLLTERLWLSLLTGVLIIYMVTNNKITFKMIRNTLILLSWLSLITFIFFYLLIDPYKFDKTFTSYLTLRGVHYKFNPYFIIFAIIYYTVNFFDGGKKTFIDIIILIPFWAYILFFDKGRGLILILIITIIIILVYLKEKSFKKTVSFIFVSYIVLLSIFFIEWKNNGVYYEHFKQAFTVLTGKYSSDVSANSRILQMSKIVDFQKENTTIVFLGSGKISNKWQGGVERILGYFHPSDLGIIGGIFIYGIIGTILILSLFFYIFISKREKISEESFYISIKFFLIYLLLRSILTGIAFFNPAELIIPSSILFAYKKYKKLDD